MSYSGIKHEPEIITVVFDDPKPWGDDDQRYTVVGAVAFDEHGCEIGIYNIMWDYSHPDYLPRPYMAHPDRDLLGWPRGWKKQPAGVYDNVDCWAAPSAEEAIRGVIHDAAYRADTTYSNGLSWYAACETCEGPDGPQEVQHGAA